MVKIHMRQLFFLYVTITTVAFIWFFSSSDKNINQEEKLEELIEWYRKRNKELQDQVEGTKKLKHRDSEIEKFGKEPRDQLSFESKLQQLQKTIVDTEEKLKQCKKNTISKEKSTVNNFPTIYLITPTYSYPEQKANLIGLSHTLLHIKNIHWILIEDAPEKTNLVSNFLKNCGISYTHLTELTPQEVKLKQNDPTWLKPKGVLQRNAALKWIRENVNPENPGVVYFADDDNTYSLEVFEEMRYTKKVTVWPVGLVGGLRYEKPNVKDGKVVTWFTYWKPERPFPMDMAGFAINLKLFFDSPTAWFSNAVPRGYLESTILEQLHVKLWDLEPKADNCTKVLVWHTRTEKTKLANEKKMIKKYGHGSDMKIEV